MFSKRANVRKEQISEMKLQRLAGNSCRFAFYFVLVNFQVKSRLIYFAQINVTHKINKHVQVSENSYNLITQFRGYNIFETGSCEFKTGSCEFETGSCENLYRVVMFVVTILP